MAKTVLINGVTYDGVSKVQMPLASNPSQLVEYHDTSDAHAAAASVKYGETFYADGEKKTGIMPVNEPIDKTLDALDTDFIVPTGYVEGCTVKIVPENKNVVPTKNTQSITPTPGKVICKVVVEKIPDAYQDVTQVTATEQDIKSGKKIVSQTGEIIVGTHTDPDITLTSGVLSIK